jgi:hypothetical protein
LDHWLPAWDLGTTAGVTEALGHKQSFSPLVPHRWQNHALLDRERNPQCILIADGQRPASVIRLSQQCIKSAASQDLEVPIQLNRRRPAEICVSAQHKRVASAP